MTRMLRLRLGSLAVLACLLVAAGGVAYAAKPKQAVFKVTLTATLTKDWTSTEVDDTSDCTRTTRGVGHWVAKFSTRRAVKIRALDAGRGKVRFSGNVSALAGSATQSGSVTTLAGGPPPCERLSRSLRCGGERRSFRGGWTVVRSPRRGILQLAGVRGAEPIRFNSACLNAPTEIRAIRTDLPIATGPLDARDVFAGNVPRFFITGDTEQVTTLEGEVDGRVTERVRWKLVFTRLES
jgi:hypothetical protein